MRKRLFAGLLALCMTFSVMPATAFAEEGTSESVTCTVTAECEAEVHEAGCPKLEPVKEDLEVVTCAGSEAEAEGECLAEAHIEGCAKYVVPCTKDENCGAEAHEEECPKAAPIEKEPEVVTCAGSEAEGECLAKEHIEGCEKYKAPVEETCTLTEGCELVKGHEGDCTGTSAYAGDEGGTTSTEYVAEVNGERYKTLQEAVNAAVNGGTVTVLTDIVLADSIEITSGSVTIQGEEKTITGADGKDVFYVKGGKLTLAAGLNVYAPTDCAIYIRGGEVVTSANLTKRGEKYSVIQGNGQYTGDVTINGGTITNYIPEKTAINWPQNGKLTINGGTITGGTAVRLTSGSLEITGGTLKANGTKNAYVPANGGSVVDTGDALLVETIGGDSGYESTNPVVVTGGTFKSENASAVGSYAPSGVTPVTEFITGGTFSSDPSAYVATGYEAVKVGNNYKVQEQPDVAEVVGGSKYKTLADAVAAANGKTVRLLDNTTVNAMIVMRDEMDVTIEGAGKTITFQDTKYGFGVVESTLTLGEGLNIVAEGQTCPLYVQNGTAVTSANISTVAENGYSPIMINGEFSGTVTIKGGNIVSENTSVPAIYWPGQGTLTVKGGTITGATAIYLKSGNLTITNGELVGNGIQKNYQYVESGNIPTGAAVVVENVGIAGYEAVGTVSISGGTFTSLNASAIESYTAGNDGVNAVTGFITGGTFSSDPSAYVADGYEAVTDDNNYVVQEKPYVAQVVGENKYKTLQEAVNAAPNGGTVKVLTDIELTASVKITDGMNVTVEGAGKTITGANGKDVFYVKGGKLTLGAGLNVYAPTDCAIYILGGEVVTSANLTKDGTSYSVIQGNGQYTGDVTINGGEITNEITDKCAIYWPQNGKLTINGGTITGGTAVRLTSGSLKITGGTLIANGTKKTYVPSNGGSVADTGDALMIENIGGDTGYEAITSVSITGGTFGSVNASAVGSYDAGKDETVNAMSGFITGGIFSSKPSDEYVAEGYEAVGSTYVIDGIEYKFEVVEENSINAETATKPAETKGDVSNTVPAENKEIAKEMSNTVQADDRGLVDSVASIKKDYAASEETVEEAVAILTENGVTVDRENDTVTTVVKPYLVVEVKDVDTAAVKDDTTIVSLDINMLYDVVVTTATDLDEIVDDPEAEDKNAFKIIEGEQVQNPKPVTISFQIPADLFNEADFADGEKVLYIEHIKDDGSVYYHEATLTDGEDFDTVTFYNDKGYSEFNLMVGDEVPEDKPAGTSGSSVGSSKPSSSIATKVETGEAIPTSSVSKNTVEEGKEELATLIGDSYGLYKLALAVELEGELEKATKVKILVDDVTKADSIIILQKTADGWKAVSATAGDGYVIGKFTSLSEILIFVNPDGEIEAAQMAAATAQAAGTTPAATGDSANVLGYAVIIIAAAAALVVLYFRKRRA